MTSKIWLEEQYRPWKIRKEPVDVEEILVNWANSSAEYLECADLERDVSYGTLPAERLDLLKPARAEAPVLVFIHGGYWQSLDKDDYAFALKPLVDAGALVASVNYTLCPEVSLDGIVAQIRKACAWVWRHAGDYGGKQGQIHVSGHSAGGHLTAMLAATDWPAYQSDLPQDMITSAIPISGLFDLEPLRRSSVNDVMQMDSEMARRNSPIYLSPATAMPISVVVGDQETEEFRRQSRDFAEAWREAAGSMAYIETPGHHFAAIEAMLEPGNALTTAILQHLGLSAPGQ